MTDYGTYPTPDHFILHISDTHFVENRGKLHDIVDSDANLAELFEALHRSLRTGPAGQGQG